ncbi:hypothetical protein ACROYT_G000521 [Oculina patagonica]
MTSNLTLYECLQQVSLERYHGKFLQRGIADVGGLLSLTMQDYPSLGISSMADRQNLFYLIQTIKTMQPESKERQLRSATKKDGLLQLEGSAVKGKDKKSGAKRPREATENSPVAVKIKTKTQEKTSGNTKLSSVSRSEESVNTAGFYNYGVPSNKPKPSTPMKRHHSSSELGPSRIQVCVRKRPLSQAELDGNEEDVVTVTSSNTIELTAPKLAVDLTKYTQKYQFVFDEAFDESCSNKDIYERTAQPLIKTVFNRGKATCFAYGCTGSGKTFTMLGNEDVQGIYVLAASEIFTILHNGTHGDGLGLWISFYEIYCGQLFDLLNGRARLFAREDGNHQVCIVGLTEQRVHNVEDLMEVIEYGGGVRSTGATGVNADSSRSHAILQLEVKVVNTGDHVGRFSFIDLAGCERAADVTDTDKQTCVEGAEINQSLLALKECIRALDLDSKHTPFRQSKLTQVLKDSFVGNCQTCMIANISPNKSCSENTLNTLRYADRVKELKKDSAVTPSPRPLTVPTTIAETDRLLSVNKTSGLPRMEIQPAKVGSTLNQLRSSPRKLKMADSDPNGASRPKTTATTTSSPRNKDPIAKSHLGNAPRNVNATSTSSTGVINAKKRLAVPQQVVRPQTSPEVVTVKNRIAANRTQGRLRTSNSKRKPGNATQINSNCFTESMQIISEEKPRDAQEDNKVNSAAEVLVVAGPGAGFNNGVLSDEARPISSLDQGFGEIESISRLSYTDKQLKEPSPPSRNNRYGNGIKTRLAKLFNKGNACMEEPKVVEPHRSQGVVHAPHLSQAISGNHRPTRDLIHLPSSVAVKCDGSYLSLDQEQFVASHHTQLAMVTGLCHEEMVLLKQIGNGQKDFKDYLTQLDDILMRKVACIESLREKLSK